MIGVIFDLDGVLVDSAEFHYRAWQALADRIGVPFDREANDALRGVDRVNSLLLLLGPHADRFSEDERQAMCTEKNADYVRLVETITPADLLPGARRLLDDLQRTGIPAAVASSSKNARRVIERLEIGGLLAAVVDGAEVTHAKPDPELFLLAAARLGVPPAQCIVVEDAEAGVDAGRRGGMRVIGIGDPARVGTADRVCASVADITLEMIQELIEEPVA